MFTLKAKPSPMPVCGIKACGGGDPGNGVGGGSVGSGVFLGLDGSGEGLSTGGGVLVAVGIIAVGVGVSVGKGVAVGRDSRLTTRPTLIEPGSPLAVKVTW